KSFGYLIFAAFLSFFSLPSYAYVPDVGPTKCVANCNAGTHGGGYGCGGPAGPTEEELKQQREKKDLQDAALDANDEAYEAFQNGNYAEAVRLFKEALDEDPDNADIQRNLGKAEAALNRSS